MSFYNHQNGKKQKFDNGNCRVSLVVQLIKNLPVMQETRVQSLVGKTPWRREWLPTPVFLSGEFHGQGSLQGYSPQYNKESELTLSLGGHKQNIVRTRT